MYIQPGNAVVRQHKDLQGNPMSYHRQNNCTANCSSHSIHRQTEPDNVAYKKFLASDEAKEAGITSAKEFSARLFRSLRPWWVARFKRQFCVCTYHLSFAKLLEAYRLTGLQIHKNCTCQCELCRGGACKTHP